jgi:hypothetical protein
LLIARIETTATRRTDGLRLTGPPLLTVGCPAVPELRALLRACHATAPGGDQRAAAIVDRLIFGGNIIETGTDSYRPARTRARAERAGVNAAGR